MILHFKLQFPNINSLINELGADTEGLRHVSQREGAVRLQQLAVGLDPHLPHIVAVVWGKQPVFLHLLLHHGCKATYRIRMTAEKHINASS